jgi:hypothetical protein
MIIKEDIMSRFYSKPKKTRRRKASKTKEMTTLAYKLGQIEAGKKNPESKVYESYHKGLENKKKSKKPLF